ncbi:G3ST4 sulfotransferase, partial [Oxylabes madagascariensis]|nr:G3ST4 sulfotransferase [Oxylabes madagascariensis]
SRQDAEGPSPEQARRLRRWNSLDWQLYLHFNRTFWRRVEEFGVSRMEEEVRELRRRREVLARRCLRGGGPVPPGAIPEGKFRPFQPPGAARILGLALRPGLRGSERRRCGRMALPE